MSIVNNLCHRRLAPLLKSIVELILKGQKFYMIVMLVAVTTIENLVANLRVQHQRSANEVRQKSKFGLSDFFLACMLIHVLAVQQSMIEDDDIIAGPQKMSLRCPVSLPAF